MHYGKDRGNRKVEKKNRLSSLLQELFEELLNEEKIDVALAGSLEILVPALKGEAGTIWLLDKDTNRLVPMFHVGQLDLTNVSIELGTGVESYVTKTGESVLKNGSAQDERYTGTILEEYGLPVRNMICVPLQIEGDRLWRKA